MKVNRLSVEQFRNLENRDFCPCPGVNVITGENAQGKTNLLEALWLFTGGKSFRLTKDKELIRFGQEESRLSLDFTANGREQQAKIVIHTRRRAELNGVPLSSAAKMAGVFCGVVFCPSHLLLIKGGPQERRHLMDAAYCQLRPAYVGTLSAFTRILTQRNALCKSGDSGFTADELLDLWDRQLAQTGCQILYSRQLYLRRMLPVARCIYEGLSGGRESFDLIYTPTVPVQSGMTAAEMAQVLYEELKKKRKVDLSVGFTTVGPQRDDLEVQINGKSARSFGSQGQQRSAVLALKLAEATLLEDITGEPPVALLDDVMSELDASRQDYILNHLKNWQVFITCCDAAPVLRLIDGKKFLMNGGKLST